MSEFCTNCKNLADKIEELEISNDERLKIWNESITTPRDKIDAAWRMANDDVLYSVEQCKLMVWILKKLGIVRCEGCYSCMEKDSAAARMRLDCGGHGWVVRDE